MNERTTQEKVKQHICRYYQPVASMRAERLILINSKQLHEELQGCVPGSYTVTDVNEWMNSLGFILRNTGGLNMEWLLQKK